MDKLIEALQIFLKYGNPRSPTHCEHDILHVMVDPAKVSSEDLVRLAELGFHPDEDLEGQFYSYRYGSA